MHNINLLFTSLLEGGRGGGKFGPPNFKLRGGGGGGGGGEHATFFPSLDPKY